MKALIIGAAGFVGSYLIQHLTTAYDWGNSCNKAPQ